MARTEWVIDQGCVDEVDVVAHRMEEKWGIGRLRLLVPLELRHKFDSQRAKFNDAINGRDSATLRAQAKRMLNAYAALDKAAEASGARMRPEMWEIVLGDTLFGICRTDEDVRRAHQNVQDGMKRQYWSLEEVAKLIAAQQPLNAIKDVFDGATLENMRRTLHVDPVPVARESELDDSDKLDEINWTGDPNFVPPSKAANNPKERDDGF